MVDVPHSGTSTTEEKNKGNKYVLGRKHTEEERAKMSEARKGKPPWNKGMKKYFLKVRRHVKIDKG